MPSKVNATFFGSVDLACLKECKDLAVQAEAARAGQVESQRIKANASRNKASAKAKAASEAVIIIPLSASGLPEWVGYEWIISAQTSDYLDWVDSPWQGSRPR